MRYYPINIDIAGRKVLVVGGGRIAWRKVQGVLACGADVTVVSPEFCSMLKNKKGIRRMKRHYRKTDMKSACLVISATDSEKINRRVYDHAMASGILVNVVDVPALCTFTLPAIVSRGELLIAISTGGASPAFARWMRERLEKEIGPVFAKHLEILREMRPLVQSAPFTLQQRGWLLTRMARDRVHRIIKEKGVPEARRVVQDMLAEALRKVKRGLAGTEKKAS